jgi:hypothetical protein
MGPHALSVTQFYFLEVIHRRNLIKNDILETGMSPFSSKTSSILQIR